MRQKLARFPHAVRTLRVAVAPPLGRGCRCGEAEQRVAIVFILLATQGNFSRQSLADGVRQRVEAVENLHNAALLGERGEGERLFHKLLCIDGREISNDCVLFAPFVDDEEIVKRKLRK